jgi:hypothetical protein
MVEETKKQPEVELDMDDVNETEIQLKDKTQDKKTEPNLNVGEVDLGYTTYDNKKEKTQIIVDEQEKSVQPKVETKEESADDYQIYLKEFRKELIN